MKPKADLTYKSTYNLPLQSRRSQYTLREYFEKQEKQNRASTVIIAGVSHRKAGNTTGAGFHHYLDYRAKAKVVTGPLGLPVHHLSLLPSRVLVCLKARTWESDRPVSKDSREGKRYSS